MEFLCLNVTINKSCLDNANTKRYNDQPFAIKILMTFLFFVIFSISFFGNVVIIYLFGRYKSLRTKQNLSFANLSIADILISVFCIFPQMLRLVYYKTPPNKYFCKLIPYIQSLSYTASVMVLIMISIERYVAIVHPMSVRSLITYRRLRTMLLCIWLFSTIYNLPNLMYHTYVLVEPERSLCYHSKWRFYIIDDNIYTLMNICILYAIPLLLMIVIYIRISHKMSKRFEEFQVAQSGSRVLNNLFLSNIMQLTFMINEETTCSIKSNNNSEFQSLATKLDEPPLTKDASSVNIEAINSITSEPTDIIKSPDEIKLRNSVKLKRTNMGSMELIYKKYLKPKRKVVSNEAKFIFQKKSSSLSQNLNTTSSKNSCMSTLYLNMRRKQRNQIKYLISNEILIKSSNKLIRFFYLLVFSFAFNLLPYQINLILSQFGYLEGFQKTNIYKYFVQLAFLAYYLNSAFNCIIYFLLSNSFRKYIRRSFGSER